jgi:hypothetical protein
MYTLTTPPHLWPHHRPYLQTPLPFRAPNSRALDIISRRNRDSLWTTAVLFESSGGYILASTETFSSSYTSAIDYAASCGSGDGDFGGREYGYEKTVYGSGRAFTYSEWRVLVLRQVFWDMRC